jgi:hypothetical protein
MLAEHILTRISLTFKYLRRPHGCLGQLGVYNSVNNPDTVTIQAGPRCLANLTQSQSAKAYLPNLQAPKTCQNEPPQAKAQPTPKVPAGSGLHSRPRQAKLIPRAPLHPLRPKTNPHPAFLSHSRTRPRQCRRKARPSRPLGQPDSPDPLHLPIETGSRRHCIPRKRPQE